MRRNGDGGFKRPRRNSSESSSSEDDSEKTDLNEGIVNVIVEATSDNFKRQQQWQILASQGTVSDESDMNLIDDAVEEEQLRVKCIDYEERGFCIRGDYCPHEHGQDRLILQNTSYMPAVPMLSPDSSSYFYQQERTFAAVDHVGPSSSRQHSLFFGQRYNVPFSFRHPRPTANVYRQQRPHFSARTSASYQYRGPRMGEWQQYQGSGFRPCAEQRSLFSLDRRPRNVIEVPTTAAPPVRGGASATPVRASGSYASIFGSSGNQVPVSQCILEIQQVPTECNRIPYLHNIFSNFGMVTLIQVEHGGDSSTALIGFSKIEEATSAFSGAVSAIPGVTLKVGWFQHTCIFHQQPVTVQPSFFTGGANASSNPWSWKRKDTTTGNGGPVVSSAPTVASTSASNSAAGSTSVPAPVSEEQKKMEEILSLKKNLLEKRLKCEQDVTEKLGTATDKTRADFENMLTKLRVQIEKDKADIANDEEKIKNCYYSRSSAPAGASVGVHPSQVPSSSGQALLGADQATVN